MEDEGRYTRGRDAKWTVRRTALIAEVTSAVRAQFPSALRTQLTATIMAEVDLRMLYERFGNEP